MQNGGETVARTLLVPTHVGDVEVSLRVPYEREPTAHKPSYDVLADLFELGQDGHEIDAEARRPLEDELLRRFAASPEAKTLTDIQSCHFVMDFAADYFNATVATLGPRAARDRVRHHPAQGEHRRVGGELDHRGEPRLLCLPQARVRTRASFDDYFDAVDATPDEEWAPSEKHAAEQVTEELRLRCTSGMLRCLDREQHINFILGALFGVSHTLGGEILGISPGNFRVRLHRARADLQMMVALAGERGSLCVGRTQTRGSRSRDAHR